MDPDTQDLPRVSICICGDNVVVTMVDDYAFEREFQAGNYLYVFNWKTGDNKGVCETFARTISGLI